MDIYGDQSWHRLCKFMPNKTEIRCFKRWLYLRDRDNTSPKHQFSDVVSVEHDDQKLGSSTERTSEQDTIIREKAE